MVKQGKESPFWGTKQPLVEFSLKEGAFMGGKVKHEMGSRAAQRPWREHIFHFDCRFSLVLAVPCPRNELPDGYLTFRLRDQ